MPRRPDFADAYHLYGSALRGVNQGDQAAAAYAKAWELGFKTGATLLNLTKCTDQSALNTLDPMIKDYAASIPAQSDPLLHFAKAELAHRRQHYAEAYAHWVKGNALAGKASAFDLQAETEAAARMMDLFAQPVETAPPPPGRAPEPIFILGMPRSGSTLLESVLGAHDDVTDLGELGEIVQAAGRLGTLRFETQQDALKHIQKSYLSSAAVTSARPRFVVDKYLGHILYAFPYARILQIQCDPHNMAWSIFRQRFSEGQAEFAYKVSVPAVGGMAS